MPDLKPRNPNHLHIAAPQPTLPSPLPPQVTPYALKTRHDKSFENQNCCFCEESLEIQLTGEKVLALECGHSCHFQCLLQLVDLSLPFDSVNPDSVMPTCSTCEEPSIPLDTAIYKDLVKQVTALIEVGHSGGSSTEGSDCEDQALILQDIDAIIADADDSDHAHRLRGMAIPRFEPLSISKAPKSANTYPDPFGQQQQQQHPANLGAALKSPVAQFTDSIRLHKQSTTMHFAISPWEFEPATPRNSGGSDIHYVEITSPGQQDLYQSPPTSVSAPKNMRLLSTITDSSLSSFSDRSSDLSSFSSFSSSFKPLAGLVSASPSPSSIANTTAAYKPQELASGIPDEILKMRLRRYKFPSVQLTTEAETLYVPPGAPETDTYVTTLITVKAPPKPDLNLHDDPYLTQPRAVDAKVRAELAAHVKQSLPDWKTLDPTKFGALRVHDKFDVSRDQVNWQTGLDCYLFDTLLVFVRVFPNLPCEPRRSPQLKGNVDIRNHLVNIAVPRAAPPDYSPTVREYQMTLRLSTPSVPTLHLRTSDPVSFENWHTALMCWTHVFPLTRLVSPDDHRGQAIASQMFPEAELAPSSPRAPTSAHVPTDSVILVPLAGSPMGSKFPAIKEAILAIIAQMQLYDRLAVVPYGAGTATAAAANANATASATAQELAQGSWPGWAAIIDSLHPTGARGSRSDMIDGLDRALAILEARQSLNPIASVYVISDSAAGSSAGPGADFADVDKIVARAAARRVKINSAGVTMNHLADDLDVLSTKTGGTYHYLRAWDELGPAALGKFRATQQMSYCDVSLCIDLVRDASDAATREAGENADGENDYITISEISGHAIDKTPVSQAAPLPSPLLPSPTATEAMPPQQRVKEHLVKLGDMAAGETRTFLVQVRVRPEAIAMCQKPPAQDDAQYEGAAAAPAAQLGLFNASLSYVGYSTSRNAAGNIYFLPIGSVAVPLETCSQDLLFPFSPSAASVSRESLRMTARASSRASYASSLYSSLYESSHYSGSTVSLDRKPSKKLPSLPVAATAAATARSSGRWFPANTDKPSILFGELVPWRARGDARASSVSAKSVYLSLELYDVRVVQRRIELTAANLFEYIVRAGFGGDDDDDEAAGSEGSDDLETSATAAPRLRRRTSTSTLDMNQHALIAKVLDNVREGRAIVHGLLACAVALRVDKETCELRNTRIIGKNWQHEAPVEPAAGANEYAETEDIADADTRDTVHRTKALVRAIDSILTIVSEHLERADLYAFEQDYRKLMMQYIGVLRLQKAYTTRTALERLYM